MFVTKALCPTATLLAPVVWADINIYWYIIFKGFQDDCGLIWRSFRAFSQANNTAVGGLSIAFFIYIDKETKLKLESSRQKKGQFRRTALTFALPTK